MSGNSITSDDLISFKSPGIIQNFFKWDVIKKTQNKNQVEDVEPSIMKYNVEKNVQKIIKQINMNS